MIDISLHFSRHHLALENKFYECSVKIVKKALKATVFSFEGVKITSFGVLQQRKANNFSNGSTVVFRETAGRLESVL